MWAPKGRRELLVRPAALAKVAGFCCLRNFGVRKTRPKKEALLILNLGELFADGMLFFAFSLATVVVLLVAQHLLRGWESSAGLKALTLFCVNGAAGLATWFLSSDSWPVLVPLLVGLVVAIASSWTMPNFTVPGRLFLMNHVPLALFAVAWGTWFIATIPISTLTRTLMFVGCPLLIFTLPFGLVSVLEQWE